jgi:hypothetical protein
MTYDEKVMLSLGKEVHQIASRVLTVGAPKDTAYARREFTMRDGHQFTMFIVKGKEVADQMDQVAKAVFDAKDVPPQ